MMILLIGSYLRLESGTSGVTDAFSNHNFPPEWGSVPSQPISAVSCQSDSWLHRQPDEFRSTLLN